MKVLEKKEFLVDETGQPKAVVLGLSEYNKMLKLIEDLEDSLDLKHAVETSSEFISHEQFLNNIKKRGLI